MVVDATICVSALSTFATKALRATVWAVLTQQVSLAVDGR